MPAKADKAEVHTANKTANEADSKANEADAGVDMTNKLDELAVVEGQAAALWPKAGPKAI
jgi:hypothetical protein